MKFFDRLRIWGKAKGEKVFNVSELEKAKDTQQKLKEQLVTLKNAYNQSRAEKTATETQLENFKEMINKCDRKFAQLAQEGDKAKAQIVHEKKKSIQVTIKSLEATLQVQTTAIERLEKQKNICEKNLVKVDNTINAIKVKERYAEQVDKYQAILDKANVNNSSMDEIEFNVDVKFNEADLRMKDLENAQEAETILDDLEDEDFESAFKAASENKERANKPEGFFDENC